MKEGKQPPINRLVKTLLADEHMNHAANMLANRLNGHYPGFILLVIRIHGCITF